MLFYCRFEQYSFLCGRWDLCLSPVCRKLLGIRKSRIPSTSLLCCDLRGMPPLVMCIQPSPCISRTLQKLVVMAVLPNSERWMRCKAHHLANLLPKCRGCGWKDVNIVSASVFLLCLAFKSRFSTSKVCFCELLMRLCLFVRPVHQL